MSFKTLLPLDREGAYVFYNELVDGIKGCKKGWPSMVENSTELNKYQSKESD